MDHKKTWKAFSARREAAYYSIIFAALNANMLAAYAAVEDADEDDLVHLATVAITSTQLSNTLIAILLSVGADWGVISKRFTNRAHNIKDPVTAEQIRKEMLSWAQKTAQRNAELSVITQKKQIQTIYDEGVKNGLSIEQIKQNIKNNKYTSTQAIIISRLSVTSGASRGTLSAAAVSPYMHTKTWWSRADERVRDPRNGWYLRHFGEYPDFTHREVHGQTIHTDTPFWDTLGYIMFPGDPDADPGNIINCRCWMITNFVIGPDGKPVLKKIAGLNANQSRSITVIHPNEIIRPTTITF